MKKDRSDKFVIQPGEVTITFPDKEKNDNKAKDFNQVMNDKKNDDKDKEESR